MAENYREQQQEEAEGIVDAGGIENDPGTGMIAEDQETAAAAEVQPAAVAEAPVHDDEEAIAEAEASENVDVQVDLHENTGSGIDIAVVIIVLLVIIGCLSFAFWNSQNEPATPIVAQQQAAQPQQTEAQSKEPPFAVAELSEGVAAVVNGQEVMESEVDEYISDFRKLYDLTDDDAWAEWMVSMGYTPEVIRNNAVSTIVDDKLVNQAVKELDVQVTQEQVDALYNETRESFETEEEWQEALQDAGLTDEAFREQCERTAQRTALMELLGDSAYSPEELDAEIFEYVKGYYPDYATAASLADIPAEVVNPIREMVEVYAQQSAYDEFLTSSVETGDIVMSAMPKDAPYNVNMLDAYINNISAQFERNAALQELQEQEQPAQQ